MSHYCLCEFGYKVSFVFRKEKLGRGDGSGAGGSTEKGSKTHDRGPPRKPRCANHRASEERTVLSQAEK